MGIIKLTQEELHGSRPSLQELSAEKRFPVSVVLENIRSLYNVGAVFRTCDGAFIEKIYICGYTGFPPRKEIDKTALGSTESVPWERVPNTYEVLYGLRSKGYQIVCLEQCRSSVSYDRAEYRFPLCLVLGNEVGGVSDGIVNACDMAVDIPMYGLKQSLNVSVAAGIAVYQIIRSFKEQIKE